MTFRHPGSRRRPARRAPRTLPWTLAVAVTACIAALAPQRPVVAAAAGAHDAAGAASVTADRNEPTNVESDRMQHDDAKGLTVFTGNVVLTRGTVRIRGDRLTIVQQPDGQQTAQTVGNPASFRQRRDDTQQVIEGFGRRIDYDSRSERVTLSGQARVNRFLCDRPADTMSGAVVVYNARTETIDVDGQPMAAGATTDREPAGGGSQRVRVVIQPRQEGGGNGGGAGASGRGGATGTAEAGHAASGASRAGADCAPAAPLKLQPAPRVGAPAGGGGR